LISVRTPTGRREEEPASASHACGADAFDDFEVCFYRIKGYYGGSRAFTHQDVNFTNDYYDYDSSGKSLNNTISAYYNKMWAPVMAFRYVGLEGSIFDMDGNTWDSDLASSSWWNESGNVDNKLSSLHEPCIEC
jgi:hypothetical protein